MDVIAPVVKNILYPLWLIKNRNRERAYLREYESTQYYSAAQIRELQWQRLQKMLHHAFDTCPFYTSRFRQAGVTPDDIKSPDELVKIPPLAKTEIQTNLDTMKSAKYGEHELIRDKTGGSTGSPLVFYYDKERPYSRQGAALRHDGWTGWQVGKKIALLWGAPSDLIGMDTLKGQVKNLLLSRRVILDASSITEEKLQAFTRMLKFHKPQYFLAYANVMALYAKFVNDNKIRGIHPRSIITSAEVLTPENRALIENTFGCRIFNRYGCREVAVIASECPEHTGMHINAENLYVEIVREGRHAGPGETGEVLITDLMNFGMPLIRYRIGDMGSLLDRSCSCGRGLPLMDMVSGRVTDFIVTPDDRRVSGVAIATYVITNIPGIQQIQFIQNSKYHVTIKLVKNGLFTGETLAHLDANMKRFLGAGVKTGIQYADIIPVEPSGKYRFSISFIQ